MLTAYLFPGQGAQYVGMAARLVAESPEARRTLEEADEAIGFSIARIIAQGPDEVLRQTYNTQPAILAASIACLRAFQARMALEPAFVAGHSLGEYTALVATGTLAFADAVRLVHARGRFMEDAVPAGQGSMAAVLGADAGLLSRLCEEISTETAPVELANVNCPGQIVVSGATSAVDTLIDRASEAKARRAIRLDVSGPFHCSLMKPAQDQLREALTDIAFAPPVCPVVVNVTGKAVAEPNRLKAALAEQVSSPVLWEATVRTLSESGVSVCIEFGPGTVLSGLVKKTAKDLRALHVEDPESLEQTLTALDQEVGA
ncbi:MAG: ACP S-malonyltransferase [Firmicutes bacterium]|nr:ACP S-malonyltransferase [Bacillota bacterium]